jgi:hypothetical protein
LEKRLNLWKRWGRGDCSMGTVDPNIGYYYRTEEREGKQAPLGAKGRGEPSHYISF